MHALICFMVLACGSPKKLSIPLRIAGQFDAATTYHLLSTCKNCYEVNPLARPFARSPALFPAAYLGDAGVLAFARRLGVRHKRLAVAVVIGVTAVHVWLGIHNLRLAARQGVPNAGSGGKRGLAAGGF